MVMQMHYHIHMNEDDLQSSLTDRYQTTVPARIRKALGLGKRDKLEWILDESGGVQIRKVALEHEDPILDSWLDFLADDIEKHPERLIPLDAKWYEDMVTRLSGEPGKGISGFPPTLEEFLAQPDLHNED